MELMKQILLAAPERIETRELPIPDPLPGEVIAKTLYTGICGTDVHSYFGETIFDKVFPFHIGHEICARVTAVGDGVQTVAPEDIIVVNPFFTCGACTPCYMGQENGCEHKTTIGLKGFGGFSDYVRVPATSAFPVHSDNYPAMSLAEPLSTVIYGYEKLRTAPTQRVLIQGIGSIGLMFLQLAVRTGFTQIVVSDFSHEKLSIAKQLGADLALCPLDDADKQTLDALSHRGFDIIIDCTGSIKSMQTTVDRLAFGGQILLFGLCSAELSMEIKPFRLYQKDASLMTSFALTKHSFRKAIAMLENGQINTELLIDSVRPRAQLEQSILDISQGRSAGKIIIDTCL